VDEYFQEAVAFILIVNRLQRLRAFPLAEGAKHDLDTEQTHPGSPLNEAFDPDWIYGYARGKLGCLVRSCGLQWDPNYLPHHSIRFVRTSD
jgi:hypothetical protein